MKRNMLHIFLSLRMRPSDEEIRLANEATCIVSWHIACLVPVEFCRLCGRIGAKKDSPAVAMAMQFVDTSTTLAMQSRRDPERAQFGRRAILRAACGAVGIHAGIDWWEATKEKMRSHRQQRTPVVRYRCCAQREQRACRLLTYL